MDYLVYYHVSDLFLSFQSVSDKFVDIAKGKMKEWISIYGLPTRGIENSYFFLTPSPTSSSVTAKKYTSSYRQYDKKGKFTPLTSQSSQPTNIRKHPPPPPSSSVLSSLPISLSPSPSPTPHSTHTPADRRKFHCQIPIRFFTFLLRLCGPLCSLFLSDLLLLLFYSLLEPKYERQLVFMQRLRGRGKGMDALIPEVANERELNRGRVEILRGEF